MSDPTRALLDAAVEAYREHERVLLLVAKKERAMLHAVAVMAVNSPPEIREEYVQMTGEINTEFEKKREKAGLA